MELYVKLRLRLGQMNDLYDWCGVELVSNEPSVVVTVLWNPVLCTLVMRLSPVHWAIYVYCT